MEKKNKRRREFNQNEIESALDDLNEREYSWTEIKSVINQLKETPLRSDYSSDRVFANFREIPAPGIAKGVIYRSSHPAQEDARAPYVVKLCKKAKITVCINLADGGEFIAQNMERFPDWYKDMVKNGKFLALGMWFDSKTPDFLAKTAAALRFFIENDGPCLIHCYMGADRTGFISAVLEALMGATVGGIIDDYMATQTNYYHLKRGEERYIIMSQLIKNDLKRMNRGIPLTDENAAKSAERFIREELKFSKDELRRLKNRLSGGIKST